MRVSFGAFATSAGVNPPNLSGRSTDKCQGLSHRELTTSDAGNALGSHAQHAG